MKQLLLADSTLTFWHPIPHTFNELNNKKGVARFIYLTLSHYFFYYKAFPDFAAINEDSEKVIKQVIS